MTSAIEEVSLSEAKRIARFMGLPRWQDMDDLGLVASVSRGFPVRTATTVAQRIDPESRFLRPSDIIPKSTLHRREKARKPLSKDESEKIWALAKVLAELLRIYHDDTSSSAQFMLRAHPMLGDRTPLDLATESVAGADLVLRVLSKADAGVAA